MNQTIRIIGGTFRGKKISFPAIEHLRPTPDRVRETLFNWLMHDIRGATCIDAFAGSGALGFEAFSRGAGEVTLIEYSSVAFTHLKKQAQLFQSNRLHVVHADIRTFLAKPGPSVDLIFYDPPFSQSTFFETTLQHDIYHRLHPNGLLYLESPRPVELNPEHWLTVKSKKAGCVHYTLFKKKPV